MNTGLLNCVVFVFLSLVHTCGKTVAALSPADYVSWVEDQENGLSVSKDIGKLKFELQYKPLDYIVVKDNPQLNLTNSFLVQSKSEIADMQYFTFRISGTKGGDLLRNDIDDMQDFSGRLEYFSSSMQKDIKLIEGSDTLSCLLFHFERSFGVDPRSTFIVGFPLGKKDGAGGLPAAASKTFLFNDHELGSGPVSISVSSEKLKQVPSLKLN